MRTAAVLGKRVGQLASQLVRAYELLTDVLQSTIDQVDAIASREGVNSSLAMGFDDLDEVMNGLRRDVPHRDRRSSAPRPRFALSTCGQVE
ncbi:hypothetical protein DV20_27430 [Amycolatopsis rifamycinica]|uniref:Uncharacterized protein n=1 Tax=Amycolatopsis rifamycinica TaxID=287986 RepID=A0A066U490_9PSEU|nr:hypothetical protein DV20_27430 [Amycolatopsis rifamycinica]